MAQTVVFAEVVSPAVPIPLSDVFLDQVVALTSGIGSGESFGSHMVGGPQSIAISGIASGESFGSPGVAESVAAFPVGFLPI